MSVKLVLGIFLPVILIVALVILSSANIGFSVKKETVQSVQFNDLFVDVISPKDVVLIQTITITNDFFLPKKYELPRISVCLNDKEGAKEATNLRVRYNEGSYTRGFDAPVFDEIFFDYNMYSKQSVNLPANSKKQVKVLVGPQNVYSSSDDAQSSKEQYKPYDELLLIQQKDTTNYYDYSNCGNFGSEELDNAIHVPIIGK